MNFNSKVDALNMHSLPGLVRPTQTAGWAVAGQAVLLLTVGQDLQLSPAKHVFNVILTYM
jgi:hypothetical protein